MRRRARTHSREHIRSGREFGDKQESFANGSRYAKKKEVKLPNRFSKWDE